MGFQGETGGERLLTDEAPTNPTNPDPPTHTHTNQPLTAIASQAKVPSLLNRPSVPLAPSMNSQYSLAPGRAHKNLV